MHRLTGERVLAAWCAPILTICLTASRPATEVRRIVRYCHVARTCNMARLDRIFRIFRFSTTPSRRPYSEKRRVQRPTFWTGAETRGAHDTNRAATGLQTRVPLGRALHR